MNKILNELIELYGKNDENNKNNKNNKLDIKNEKNEFEMDFISDSELNELELNNI